jgi:hypothetical protein
LFAAGRRLRGDASHTMPDSASQLVPFTRQQIKNHFGERIYQKALNYFREGRVFDCRAGEDGTIRAKVRGSEFQPYSVALFPGARHLLGYAGTCTCPYQASCKHMAAVLLEVLEAEAPREGTRRDGGPIPEQYRQWLRRFEVGTDDGFEPQTESNESVLYILQPQLNGRWKLDLQVARKLLDGSWGVARSANTYGVSRGKRPKYVSKADFQIFLDASRIPEFYRHGTLLHRIQIGEAGLLRL